MNLNFGPVRTITSGSITQTVRDALVTPDFWAKWRYNKESISRTGVCLIKIQDDNKKPYWIIRKICNLSAGVETPIIVPPVPFTDKSKLLSYQVPAVSSILGSMLSNNVSLDASDTGTGKTYMALKACALSGYRPAIVCMRTAISDWKKICVHYGVNPLFIYNWESCIGRIFKKNRRIDKITQPPNKYIKMDIDPYTGKAVYKWELPNNKNICIIFDEVHKATGDGSHNQKIVLAAKHYPVMALSATLADRLDRFKTLGGRLGLFKDGEFDEWMQKQGCFIDSYKKWQPLNERQAMNELSKAIFPNFGVRIRKSDLPDFPEIQNIARLYEITRSKIQNNQYDKLIRQIEKLKEQKDTAGVLVLQLRYRQMAELNKVDLLAELVLEHIDNNMAVVVFVNFTDTLNRLSALLKTDCVIHGSQDIETRRKNIEAFQADKKRVIIANIQAGGTSINLHDLNGDYPRIALIAPTYDARQLIQAMGRIHRAGALSKAINLLVYAAGTIEEKVFSSVVTKIGNINTLNDGDLAETEIFKKE